MNGEPLDAFGLMSFFKGFVSAFQSGRGIPEAKTLLDATAEANNANALHMSLKNYASEMNQEAGPGCRHIPRDQLRKHHEICKNAALCKVGSAMLFSTSFLGPQDKTIYQRYEAQQKII
jgi:hypothetical protein